MAKLRYETRDGKFFDFAQDAEDHEFLLDLVSAAKERPGYMPDEQMFDKLQWLLNKGLIQRQGED